MPCRRSAHLQVWDQMTKEHGWQHNWPIQLLPDIGREHCDSDWTAAGPHAE